MPTKKDISQAFIEREITLKSRFSQGAYTRIYESVSGSMYLLGIVLRIIGTEEDSQAVESVTDSMIDEVSTELHAECERLGLLMENNGIEDMEASYTSPMSVCAKITSPRGSRFLTMIEELDIIACRLDCLWLSNLISDQQYSNAGYMWQRRIVRLANKIRSNTTRAIKSAQNKGNETAIAVEEAIQKSGVPLESVLEGSANDEVEDMTEDAPKVAEA